MPTYTFRIDLLETNPLVTKKFEVSSEISFYLMHHIIQAVMGWQNYHLYEFTNKNDTFNIADKRLIDEHTDKFTDCKSIMVEDVFTQIGQSILYEYDFGDSWQHELELIENTNEPQNECLPRSFLEKMLVPQRIVLAQKALKN